MTVSSSLKRFNYFAESSFTMSKIQVRQIFQCHSEEETRSESQDPGQQLSRCHLEVETHSESHSV